MPRLGDRRPPIDRFWGQVKKGRKCWLWTGWTDAEGYGRFRADSAKNTTKVLAHRWIWAHLNGPIPKGAFVCHSCDNPSCVRPDHLWLGSHQDNMDDMRIKGRVVKGNAKLTEEIVAEIRERYDNCEASQGQLARKYGVSKKQISVIVNRKQWI